MSTVIVRAATSYAKSTVVRKRFPQTTILPSSCCDNLTLLGNHDSPTGSKRWGHTVRLIALEDFPHGKAYQGDVVRVKAGYARNYLIPEKKALYATPQNFERIGIIDPDVETEEQRIARLVREQNFDQKEDQNVKQADMLKSYLRNKVLKIWRVVDPNSVDALHPGKVNAWNVRHKLSKQLKIDLEDHEQLHIYKSDGNTPLHFSELDDRTMQQLMSDMDTSQPCQVEIKQLGEYLCVITLDGGLTVPLRLAVLQRIL